MGKKTSKRNSTRYKTQLQTNSDQYKKSQATQPVVYFETAPSFSFVYPQAQASTTTSYSPNQAQDCLEYNFPIPSDTTTDQNENPSNQEMDTSPNLLQISQVKASSGSTHSQSSKESFIFLG